MNYLIVAFFAFFGGIARYGLSLILPSLGNFPLGTLTANLLGCFFFSWLVKHILTDRVGNGQLVLGIGTGFFGAFTTFSSFSLDTIKLLQMNDYLLACLYVFLSITGGLLMAFLGEYVYRPKKEQI